MVKHNAGCTEEAEAMEEQSVAAGMAARGWPILRRFRGPLGGSSIAVDYTVAFDQFNTVVCDESNGVSSGKWCYDIEIVSAALDCPQFGWADAGFEQTDEKTGDGVGDDGHSWARRTATESSSFMMALLPSAPNGSKAT